MNPLDFSGRRVLVTGGSNGIGNGIARAFRDAGADVLITGTQEAAAYDTDLADMEYAQVDLGDDEAIHALARAAGSLDVLVNNVGVYQPGDLLTYTPEAFEDVLRANLLGCFALIQACLPLWPAAGGSIINVGYTGLEALGSSPTNTAYVVSKTGLLVLTRTTFASSPLTAIAVLD